MSDIPPRSAKPISLKFKLLLICGVAAVLLIVIGLVTEPLQSGDKPITWYERIPLLFLSFTEDAWFIGKNEGGVLVVGALLARLIFLSAIILAGWAVFARQIHAFVLSRRRGHMVVIGNTPTACEVVAHLETKKRKFTHVVGTDTELAGESSRLALPFSLPVIERPAALASAMRIIVDTGDIATNMALTRAIHHAFGERAPPVSCNIESTHLADEFGELITGQSDILIYDEARLSVRDTLARHPLYASADRQGAARVHLLVIGFGRFGRVFFEEAVQDSVAGALEKPFVTVIDRQAKARAAAFERDKPQHRMAADTVFIEADVLETPLDAQASAARAILYDRDDAAPVTAIALCLPSDAENVAAAMTLRAMRRRSGRCFAPIFMHMREGTINGTVFIEADKDRIADPFNSVIPLRLSREVLAVDILAEGERDRIAKRFHAAFRELSDDRQAANVSWLALQETYRRADRHAADHMAAKLWSLGLATERHSTESPFAVDADWEKARVVAPGDHERLSRLEHERWIADRVLEGWQFADKRDDDSRLHPDLVPFEDVCGKDQGKDRKQVEILYALAKEATRDRGKQFMPELRIGLTVAPGITPAMVEAAGTEIAQRLAEPLADLAAHHVITIISSLAIGGDFTLVETAISKLKQRLRLKERAEGWSLDNADLRLLAIEGVPYPVQLKQAFKTAQLREHQIHVGLEARRHLFHRFNRVEVARIGVRGHSDDAIYRDAALYEMGRRKVSAYLARRADVLCVLGHKGETGNADLRELIGFWADPSSIPAALDCGPSRSGASRTKAAMETLIQIAV